MISILTVVTPSGSYDLTVLATVKLRMEITDGAQDALLSDLISKQSIRAANYCNRVFGLETLSELFRRIPAGGGPGARGSTAPLLALTRWPVASIVSIIEDDTTTLATTDWEIDADTGVLYRLGSDGNQVSWSASKIVVAYTAGYTLPSGAPDDLEDAVIQLVRRAWFGRKRDPMETSHGEPGLGQTTYWVGATGDGMPPEIRETLDNYRGPALA